MYRVLVVDDEPAAVQYVKKLIELKCEDFTVCGEASNGEEAIEWLSEHTVDVIITDVMMPRMNGIELVTYAQEYDRNIVSIVVSGYQDFEYVQGAIRAGVCDYVLKPIDPTEMRRLFREIKQRLDKNIFERRNLMLRRLSKRGEKQIDWTELAQLFSSEQYYAAIIRKNGLISGFAGYDAQEVYSMENEQVIIFGRDDKEMLYIYAKELIVRDFSSVMQHEFYKQQEAGTYLTMVLKEEPFDVGQLPAVMEQLYVTLDRSLVVGLEQQIVLGKEAEPSRSDRSERKFEHMMYLVRSKEIDRLLQELPELFVLWNQERSPLILVKEKVRYLFYEMQNARIIGRYDEYLFDDAFADVMEMQEISSNLCEFIRQNMVEDTSGKRNEKEEVFQSIVEYLEHHPSQKLSVQDVCKRFGISQATLNRLFRGHADMSYSSYLTDMRIRTSQALLKKNPDSYIKDVAAAVGYSDQFYFSRIFRTITGMSPTEYVERLEKE